MPVNARACAKNAQIVQMVLQNCTNGMRTAQSVQRTIHRLQ